MNWTPIYAALKTVAALSGISDPLSINWAGQPGATTAFGAQRLVMKINNIRSIGVDYEERVDATPPNSGNLPQAVTVVGQRQFTWQIRCESTSADPALNGLGILDALRVRLNRTTTDAILEAAGMGLVEIHPTMEVSTLKNQQRVIAAYVMEVVLAAAENDGDTTADAGLFIDTVILGTDMTSPATLLLPDGTVAPQQIDETIVGP